MYRIRSALWSSAVAVPTEIIDRYLKLASPASFKVLLFLLRNPDGAGDCAQIARCTGLGRDSTEEALSFWIENEVIEQDEARDSAAETRAEGNLKSVPDAAPKAAPFQALPVKKPTQREIASRLAEDPALTAVYGEAQKILGMFGYETEALILMIYDYYGFPPEVILMLLQYQKQIGRPSGAEIRRRAEDWAKRGLITLPLVEEEIRALDAIDSTYRELRAALRFKSETPTPRVAGYLRKWIDLGFSADMMLFAFRENGESFSSAGKQLEKWRLSGISTPQEAAQKAAHNLGDHPKKDYNTAQFGKNSVLDRMKKQTQGE